MNSSIFRKLLWSALLLIAATLATVDFYLTRYVRQQQTDNVAERLSIEAGMLAGDLADHPPSDLAVWVQQSGPRARTRVSVFDGNGKLLADSEPSAPSLDDPLVKAEVAQSLSLKTGRAVRAGGGFNRQSYYLSVRPAPGARPPMVLRLASTLEDSHVAANAVRLRILATSLAAAILALLIAFLLSRWLNRRIVQLKRFAETFLSAGAARDPVIDSSDELGSLGRSMQRMAAQIRELIERLNLESARREAIISSMAEGVLAVDHQLHVIFCNPAFQRAFDIRASVPERVSLLELVRDSGLLRMLNRVLQTGEPVKEHLQSPAAGNRSFEAQINPLATPSGTGAIAILHDITDLERLEQIRKDFVANVSHELRTPLAAIAGYTETLLEGAMEDPHNNRKFLEIIQNNAVRLTSIASDLLVLSEMESGAARGEPQCISLPEAVDSALQTVEAEAAARNVRIVRGNIEALEVRAHRVRLEQALLNLLVNAVKFNRPDGEVHVEVTRLSTSQAAVVITDTGIGIPSEDLPRIFERFYRVDKARSRQVGGTGLGLSIVKHAIERMNGRILVESQLGRGSKFTVILPIA